MSDADPLTHYEFGTNWARFVDQHFTGQRRQIAKANLLAFLGKQHLNDLSFLDIGSGSGLHSLAAFDADAKRIHSFDYDPMSVQTTGRLRTLAGSPQSWTVQQG